jgi:leucyl-tRNA synthetase
MGADTLRMYLVFLGPYDRGGEFSDTGIGGIRRFLGRVWDLVLTHADRLLQTPLPSGRLRPLHKAIRDVSADIENLRYNTAIAALMSYLNTLQVHASLHAEEVSSLVRMLAPFAPHIAEELWFRLGKAYSIHQQPFPIASDAVLSVDRATVAVQVNGRTRGHVEVPRDAPESDALAAAHSAVPTSGVTRVVYVPGRVINLVTC